MIKKFNKKILILFLSILFWHSNAFAANVKDCKKFQSNETINNLEQIEKIYIDFNNKRKWNINLFRLLTRKKDKTFLKDINEIKQRFKSKIEVKYTSGITCEYIAFIRFHGDALDHVAFVDGHPISSLNVKLKNGNIKNIVHFLLFLPETRESDNEIFVTNFLKNVGILAPRTFYVNAEVNKKDVKFIFQESLKKEFLESNNLVEGSIFEGHENFSVQSKIGSRAKGFKRLARLTNETWTKNSKYKTLTSVASLSDLNVLYLSDPYLHKKKNYVITNIFSLDPTLLNKEERKSFNLYESFMFALDTTHNLSRDDRRFYYDQVYGKFVPIYYDGMSNILDEQLENIIDNFNLDINRNKKELVRWPSVTSSAKEGALDAIKLVKKIDRTKLLNDLEKSGLKITTERLDKIINLILERLNKINNAIVQKKDYITDKSHYSKFAKYSQFQKDKLVFFYYDGNNYFLRTCNFDLSKCSRKEKTNLDELKIVLNQKYNNEISEHIFVGNNYDEYKTGEFKRNKLGFKTFKKINIGKNIKIATNNYVKFNINNEKKIIELEQIDWRGRAIIFDSILDNWKIIFNKKNLLEDKTAIITDFQNYTGCLSIIDTIIIDIEINASHLICEDSINFIRSSGTVKKIYIENSFSDGLDADFSELKFNEVYINISNNDCADFSFGKYKIQNAILKNCGDKALSVGEKSFLQLERIIAENSNMGIASKDSSIVKLKDAYLNNLKTCVSAYNKKQEFNGGLIEIQNMECRNFLKKIATDINSKIIIKNEF